MNILVHGFCGFMGKEVVKCANENYENAVLLGGIDPFASEDTADVCVKTFEEAEEKFNLNEVDCVIDFSNHTLTENLLEFCKKHSLAVVVATTGHTPEEIELIKEASKETAVFFAANMSLGVALLINLAKQAAKTMKDADIEIIEKHHNRKLDAPSGTAMAIYRELKEVRENANAVMGRSGMQKREANDIGIHAVRMGNIVGEHEVILCTPTQSITLKHEAFDRSLFAQGAVVAGAFIKDKKCGLFDMNDIVNR